jgi:hypothetical protein
MTTLKYVLDYEAMGKGHKKPARRHRQDCPHPFPEPSLGPAVWRLATTQEMQTVPPCADCLAREVKEAA